MSFLSSLKKVLNFGSDNKKKKGFQHIKCDQDPAEIWEIIGELGDGAFGKVYKARHRANGAMAAAKICELEVGINQRILVRRDKGLSGLSIHGSIPSHPAQLT